jgi:hypothetical protein
MIEVRTVRLRVQTLYVFGRLLVVKCVVILRDATVNMKQSVQGKRFGTVSLLCVGILQSCQCIEYAEHFV